MSASSPPRRKPKATTVAECLSSPRSPLADLGRKLRQLEHVKALLWPHLPSDLRPHCELANLRDTTLVLVARTPVWAARARHASPQILHAAAGVCKIRLDRVQVRVDPGVFRSAAPKRRKPLSTSTARRLEALSSQVEDRELARIMASIAARAAKGSGNE